MNDTLLESVIIGLSYYLPAVYLVCVVQFLLVIGVSNILVCFYSGNKSACFQRYILSIDCFHLIYSFVLNELSPSHFLILRCPCLKIFYKILLNILCFILRYLYPNM
ncbi:hypothetical protein B296_00054509 [Ensete ventricosum]|uniref:Uncharacterized protein n=1 Tax=Ensete ventricosum TaxID=4639 RepID=A0A426Y486_ENSVE|nr:hypothetical protein B296_00054509 [Ensete ventricosum]